MTDVRASTYDTHSIIIHFLLLSVRTMSLNIGLDLSERERERKTEIKRERERERGTNAKRWVK